MKPTLSEFLARRWGNKWAICPATAANREKHGLCITQAEYDVVVEEYNTKFGRIDLPAWAHGLVVEALRGALHATCGVDEDGRPMRLSQFMPREAAMLADLLARIRIAP